MSVLNNHTAVPNDFKKLINSFYHCLEKKLLFQTTTAVATSGSKGVAQRFLWHRLLFV